MPSCITVYELYRDSSSTVRAPDILCKVCLAYPAISDRERYQISRNEYMLPTLRWILPRSATGKKNPTATLHWGATCCPLKRVRALNSNVPVRRAHYSRHREVRSTPFKRVWRLKLFDNSGECTCLSQTRLRWHTHRLYATCPTVSCWRGWRWHFWTQSQWSNRSDVTGAQHYVDGKVKNRPSICMFFSGHMP